MNCPRCGVQMNYVPQYGLYNPVVEVFVCPVDDIRLTRDIKTRDVVRIKFGGVWHNGEAAKMIIKELKEAAEAPDFMMVGDASVGGF